MSEHIIGDPRPAGTEGPAGDQRKAGEPGPAGDTRKAGEANIKAKAEPKATTKKAAPKSE